MDRNEDETNKLLQEIRSEVIDFTTQNFFGQVVEKYQNNEKMCFEENKGNGIEFVKCMMNFQKRQIKEEKKMEFKIDYLKNEIAECLNINERNQCQQFATIIFQQILSFSQCFSQSFSLIQIYIQIYQFIFISLTQCINNIMQIQQDFLKSIELTLKK